MASDKFSPEQIEEAESLFNKPCNFVLSVAKLDQLPLTEMGEVAFGRTFQRRQVKSHQCLV